MQRGLGQAQVTHHGAGDKNLETISRLVCLRRLQIMKQERSNVI